MGEVIELDPLLAHVNRQLPKNQHVHKEDPVLGFVLLNKELMNAHIQIVQEVVKNSAHDMSVVLQQEREISKTLQANMLDKTGDHIKEQILSGLQDWEAKFNENADARLQWMRWETWISKASALLVLGFLLWQVGSWLGNKIVPDPPKSPTPVHTQHHR